MVEDTDGASQLAGALNCSGGVFDVEWLWPVTVSETIAVGNDTVLTVRGEGDEPALVDGANQIRGVVVHGGILHLSNVTVTNALGFTGGAIDAYFADITLMSCVFVSNNATYEGGAVSAQSSTVRLLGDTRFSTNTAVDGEAICAWHDASITVDKFALFEGNEAGKEEGAIFIYDLSDITINGGEFVGNRAAFGGAASLHNYPTMVVRGDTVFANNTAIATGGAVYAGNKNLIAIDGNFVWERNSADYGARHSP